MALQADGRRGFNVGLGHKHPVSYPFELRYKDDIERMSKPAVVPGTITSPWRVVGRWRPEHAGQFRRRSQPVPAARPKLFPGGMQTDWIKPGRAVWRYLDGGRNTLENMKEFSRMAGELGFEYHVVEGFWSRWR